MTTKSDLVAARAWIAARIAHETEALETMRSARLSPSLVPNEEREALLARYASALLALDEYDEAIAGLAPSPLKRDLIDALIALPQRELVEVVASALEARDAEVARPEWQAAKLVLVEAHRFNEDSGSPSPWELLVLARPQRLGEFVEDGSGPSQEGTCCGLTLAAYAKSIICPVCGKTASAT